MGGLSPGLVDTFIVYECQPFELHGTEVPQGGVVTSPVIDSFHIREDGALGLLPRLNSPPMD